MSRAGYIEGDAGDEWALIRWRGAVRSALRGKRGQAFLRELIEALDALPNHELAAYQFGKGGEYCALGAVARKRGIDVSHLDELDPGLHGYQEGIGDLFGIADAMAREIMYENDDPCWQQTPRDRWRHMMAWAKRNLIAESAP